MDRFKFRVWDKERKCFFNNDEVVIYPNGEESFFNADYDFTECVVEQCTGLKDKNGKLIYEGDVLKDWRYDVFRIVFNDEYAQFLSKDADGFVSPIEADVMENCEIIGNIHEKPDLLGDKTDE